MSKQAQSAPLQLKHGLRKRLLAALVVVLAFILLVLVSFKLTADGSAKSYHDAVTLQKNELIQHVHTLSEASKEHKKESKNTTQLLKALKAFEASVVSLDDHKSLEAVPFGQQISRRYKDAHQTTAKHQEQLASLSHISKRLIDYGECHAALYDALGKPELFKSIASEKHALASEKAWMAAAAQLRKIETNEQVLKNSAMLLSKDASDVAQTLRLIAKHFKTSDVSKVEETKGVLNKKLAVIRADAAVLAEFRHELEIEFVASVATLESL